MGSKQWFRGGFGFDLGCRAAYVSPSYWKAKPREILNLRFHSRLRCAQA